MSENVSKSGFAGTGRTVKDNGAEPVGGEQAAQQFSFAEKVFLPDEFIECLRTHSGSKRFGMPTILFLF
jgi:hypothetical protein